MCDTYLDAIILIDSSRLSKEEEILRDIGKLPHISKPIEQTRLLRALVRLELLSVALARRHGDGDRLQETGDEAEKR